MRGALAFLPALLFASQCHAQDVRTASGLLAACTGHMTEQVECMAYIAGIWDGIQYGMKSVGDSSRPPAEKNDFQTSGICVPGGVAIRQLRDVVVKHLEAHPERRDSDAAALVGVALATAYPCRK